MYLGVHLDQTTARNYKSLVSIEDIAYLAVKNDTLYTGEEEGDFILPIGDATRLERTLTVTVPSGASYKEAFDNANETVSYPVVLTYNIRRTLDSSGLSDGIKYTPEPDAVFNGEGFDLFAHTNTNTAYQLKVTVFYDAVQKKYDTAIALYSTGTEAKKQESIAYVDTFAAGSLTVMKTSAHDTFDPNIEFDVEVIFTAATGNTVIQTYLIQGDTDHKFTSKNEAGIDDPAAETISLAGRLYSIYTGKEGFTARTDLTQLTVPFKLKYNTQVTFSNIPEGVTYKVVETLPDGDKYEDPSYNYTFGEDHTSSNQKIQKGTTDLATIKNTLTDYIKPDTGISLDSLPYILILAAVGVGMIVLLMKRRTREDNE